MQKVIYSVIILCFISTCENARILCYFNIPLYSRHAAFRSLAKELVSRGHKVTILTTHPHSTENIENLTELDISTPFQSNETTNILSEKNKYENYFTAFQIFATHFKDEFERQLKSLAVQEVIRSSNKYDLLILDSSYSCPTLVLSLLLKIPVVLIRALTSNSWEYEVVRSERHALLYPYIIGRKHLINVTFWDAAVQLYNAYQHKQIDIEGAEIVDEMLRRNVGPDIPPLAELWKNVRGVIVTAHWLWDNNRPVSPNLQYVGSMLVEPENKLTEDLQEYLDSSDHGVIYLSFGSILDFSTLPQAKIEIFLNVFSALPYDVLIKCNKDIEEIPDNVRMRKWFPQADLLKHPKIKLFITQGGLHSTNEAIAAGVPLLGVPMYSDQWYNAEQYVKHEIGFMIGLESLTEARLMKVIRKVIDDSRYLAAIRQMRLRIDHRFPPTVRAALLVERVLKQSTQGKPKIENNWDLWILLVIIFLAVLMLLGYVIKVSIGALKSMFSLEISNNI